MPARDPNARQMPRLMPNAKHLDAPPPPWLIAQVEAALAAFPASPYLQSPRMERDPAWAAAERKLEKLILDQGGACRSDWQGGVVRLWGLKATSTGGLRSAVVNWLTQARVANDRAKAGPT